MTTKDDDHKMACRIATRNARAVLKPGDRIRAARCGGIKRTYVFQEWDGDWIVSKGGVCDIAAINIDRLNGAFVDFDA